MKNYYRKVTSILTIAITIPFIFYLFMTLSKPMGDLCPCFKIEYLKVYSLMLIAFISGYIWTYAYQKKSTKLAFAAIIGAILPWLNFIFNHSEYYFVVDIVYYVALLFIDSEKYDDHETAKWYYKLRIVATMIVVLSLIGITYL